MEIQTTLLLLLKRYYMYNSDFAEVVVSVVYARLGIERFVFEP